MRVNILLLAGSFNMLVVLFIAFNLFGFGKCDMEAKIVGGTEIFNITAFPYTAALLVKCVMKTETESWKCGSSIVNEKILLTAGHCVANCLSGSVIVGVVGHRDHDKGKKYTAHSFMKHELYNEELVLNDIAMVRLKSPIQFGCDRIALMEKPPYEETAQVAGWGLINEKKGTGTTILKLLNQQVLATRLCERLIAHIPDGSFCAASGHKYQYVSEGDSGSPLVVRDLIQIGIVSFKIPTLSSSMIVYTDVGYFYKWIKKYSNLLLCH